MSITWFSENQKTLVATITDNNITFNKACINLLENAYSVMLGLNFEKEIAFIKPLSKEDATRGDITSSEQYKITIRSSYARVCNIAFISSIKKIIEESNLKEKPVKFVCSFDEKEKCVVIDLKERVKQ